MKEKCSSIILKLEPMKISLVSVKYKPLGLFVDVVKADVSTTSGQGSSTYLSPITNRGQQPAKVWWLWQIPPLQRLSSSKCLPVDDLSISTSTCNS